MKHVCEYGCGEEGIYQFKNGKWCCSIKCQSCPGIRKKIGIASKKRDPWNKGKKTGQVPWNKDLKNCFSEKTLIKMRKAKEGYVPWIKGTGKPKKIKTEEEKRRNRSVAQLLTIKEYQKNYPTFAKVEEMRYEPDKEKELIIQVHCKNHNCENSKEKGGWFTPKSHEQFIYRAYAIESNKGNYYYYCSEQCKEDCPIFGKTVNQLIKEDMIAAGLIEDPWNTTAEGSFWRKYILGLDDDLCVWCGKPANTVHHIHPRKTHPELAVDPDNGLSCCRPCHFKYGHRDRWCTTGYLSKLICERIYRINKKAKKRVKK